MTTRLLLCTDLDRMLLPLGIFANMNGNYSVGILADEEALLCQP